MSRRPERCLVPIPVEDSPPAAEWTQRVGDETVAEPLALVPLLDDLLASSGDVNAVVGAPPAMVTGNRGAGQAVWCVAERDIAAGERISARDPW